MNNSLRIILIIFTLLLGLVLSGCGGGDGGGGDTASLSVSRSSISFAADRNGVTPAPETVSVSVSNTSSTLYFGAYYTDNAIDSVTYDLSSSTVPITIYPKSPGSLSPGIYTDEVTVVACSDEYCNSQISGSPLTIGVTYSVSDLSITPNSLTFSAQEGVAPASQTLTVNNITSSSSWSTNITYQGSTTGWLATSPTSGSGSSASLSVSANALPAGTYNASVVLSAGATSVSIPVTYTVSSSVTASPNSLMFNAEEGSAPLGKTVDISGLNTAWSASVRYNNASGWISVSPTSGSTMPATLTVDTSDLAAGSYSAEVVITYNVGTMTGELAIPVTYVVDPIRLEAPANVNFNIDLGSNADDALQIVTVSTNSTQNLSWSATSNADWLSLSPSSGDTDTQNQLTLSLDLGILQTLESNIYDSTVTITTDLPGVSDVQIAVQLVLDVASIDFITPYVLYENQPRTVTLKGSGLLQAAGRSIEVGSTTVSKFTITDDGEISIDIPGLPAGEYGFHIVDDLGIAPTSGRLHVKTAPQYQDAIVSIAGRPESIEYDPERDAFFAVFRSLNFGSDYVLQRIRFDGTQWIVNSLNVHKPLAVGLTVDGAELLVTTGDCELVHVDPDTLAIKSTNAYSGSCSIDRFEMVNSFDDGQILLADTNQWPNMWEYPTFATFFAPSIHNPISLRSRNRNAMLWAERPTISGPRDIYIYSSKTDTFTEFEVQDSDTYFLPYNLAINDDGKRLIHQFDVYDENQAYIGSLSGLTYNGLDRIGISPDGSRALRFSHDSKNLSIFDLSSGVGPYPQIGSEITLPADTFDSVFNVEISHDGSTAFVFGYKGVTQSTNEYKLSVTPLP
jgi:hypothetical protein